MPVFRSASISEKSLNCFQKLCLEKAFVFPFRLSYIIANNICSKNFIVIFHATNLRKRHIGSHVYPKKPCKMYTKTHEQKKKYL